MLPAIKETGMSSTTLPPAEWVKRLEQSNPYPTQNPAIELLSFFQYRHRGNRAQDSRKPSFDTTVAQRDSPSLRNIPDLVGSELINKIIAA
ncbi:Male sterility NAD-binding [Penicillium coprophilum]|uniref:Male sterility NAD-binding n=1 Tax=Penicillium coprophilum TaxID=36646 RepID=UPI0023912B92|nr:Male sterility NAD-binding [Penicillium coprophilum]KAJ5173830.1 Male sterility NAD-binding [Penicillium coprophilum]